MNDRIKLAKAMEWEHVGEPDEPWGLPPGGANHSEQMPDPFTDANDDYAVLEWMRNTWSKDKQNDWLLANLKLGKDDFLRYQIGDYARAALKVLE